MFLLETADPSRPDYNQADSLKAMRWMKQVVDNRLAAPRKWRFGEPQDAKTETDIISVGNQFAGFGDYPELSADLKSKLAVILHLAAATSDPRNRDYAGFVSNAIMAATETQPPTEARVPNLAAWRTKATRSPRGEFRLYRILQGNSFYTASPVPPMPHQKTKYTHKG